jgi:hypothetical protein
MKWPNVALAVVLALMTGCGSARAARMAPRYPRLAAEDVREIAARVAALRELPEKRPVAVVQLSPDRFGDMVRQAIARESGEQAEQKRAEAGFLIGFNLVPPPAARRDISSMQQVLEEQIAGFYDRKRDRVFVNDISAESELDDLRRRSVIAHEIHHALQAQHFDLSPLEELSDDDAALAYLALVEGDAMVAMAAYMGGRYGAPIRRTLRTITDVLEKVPLEELVRDDGGSEQLGRALPIARERLAFPYLAGMRFVADIYRAGGFELVDQLYRRPPTSTAHVLHPEQYVAGLLPVEVPAPEAPPGFRPLHSGKLGELQLRVVLAGCVKKPEAEEAAEGWAGDRYLLAAGVEGKMALLWRSVWQSEEDASELERALGANPSCWHSNEMARLRVPAALAVKRRGRDVAAVRGLEGGAAQAALEALLALPVEPAPPEPLAYRIPPREPLPEHRPGLLEGDVYRSTWLGLVGRVPSGMAVGIGKEDFEIHIERSDQQVIGRMVVSDRIASTEFNDRTFAEIGRAFVRALGGHPLQLVSQGRWRSPLGDAVEQTWAVTGTPLRVRAILVPICGGNGSLVFVEGFADAYAKHVLDGWLHSFRWMRGKARAPVCTRLDPD